jgi:hypothetical protein
MHDPMLLLTGVIATIARTLGAGADREAGGADGDSSAVPSGDRGAVSIEQVLWYAAAAVSVAVVAAIIWSQIRDTASTPVQSPSAP